MESNEADHIVPDINKSELVKTSTRTRVPIRSIATAKLTDLNNDYFNLYNDGLCHDSCNLSGSSTEEARCVPIGISTKKSENDLNNSSSSSGISDDESFSSTDLDLIERVVIGCEATTDNTKRFHNDRKLVDRKSSRTVPIASSTMIESPQHENKSTKKTLNRKDSGISESITSLQEAAVSRQRLQNQTLVLSKACSVVSEDESCSSEDNLDVNEVAMFSAIGARSLSTICSEVDDNGYAQTSFYNKCKGVPRTSTKAKLRLTPRKPKGNIMAEIKISRKRMRSSNYKPISKLTKLFTRKNKNGKKSSRRSDALYNLSDIEKGEIMMRMRYFQESINNNSVDICTLANL